MITGMRASATWHELVRLDVHAPPQCTLQKRETPVLGLGAGGSHTPNGRRHCAFNNILIPVQFAIKIPILIQTRLLSTLRVQSGPVLTSECSFKLFFLILRVSCKAREIERHDETVPKTECPRRQIHADSSKTKQGVRNNEVRASQCNGKTTQLARPMDAKVQCLSKASTRQDPWTWIRQRSQHQSFLQPRSRVRMKGSSKDCDRLCDVINLTPLLDSIRGVPIHNKRSLLLDHVHECLLR